jgi:hypothetical protein
LFIVNNQQPPPPPMKGIMKIIYSLGKLENKWWELFLMNVVDSAYSYQ